MFELEFGHFHHLHHVTNLGNFLSFVLVRLGNLHGELLLQYSLCIVPVIAFFLFACRVNSFHQVSEAGLKEGLALCLVQAAPKDFDVAQAFHYHFFSEAIEVSSELFVSVSSEVQRW